MEAGRTAVAQGLSVFRQFKMKTIFLGTPSPAVPFLQALAKVFPPALVITRPDARSGRGQQLLPCPVKEAALAAGFPVVSPSSDEELKAAVAASGADAAFVVAYGRILRQDALALLPKGFVNMHFSLLPKYRGAAPAQWALINGETETGVCAFRIDSGLDTGPLLGARRVSVSKDDDAASLMDKLTSTGVELLLETARAMENGAAVQTPQTGEASHAPKLDKKLALLDFSRNAEEVSNLVRGLQLGPLPYVLCPVKDTLLRVQVLKARPAAPAPQDMKNPGTGRIVRIERPSGFVVECKHSLLLVETVRPEGKKPMPAADFASGQQLGPGAVFARAG